MIPLFKVFMAPHAKTHVSTILDSGYVGQGDVVKQFEKKLQEYFDTPYVLTVNSGTSGLTLAARLVKDVTHRRTIAATPLTCTATNWAFLSEGFDLHWIDVDVHDCNFSVSDYLQQVSISCLDDVAALSVVHWGGYPVDLDGLHNALHNTRAGFMPYIIEDCAHAFGSSYKGKKLGNHNNIAVYSFQAIKHITSVDGGAIVLPNKELYDKAKLLRWYGLDRESSADFRCEQDIKDWGYKFHMNDVNAAIGLANLEHADNIVNSHIFNAKVLRHELEDVVGLRMLTEETGRQSSSWIFTMMVDNRQDLVKKLSAAGIMSSQVHARNDKHTCVAKYARELTGMTYVDKSMLCIPCGWWVTESDINHIVKTIRSGW